MSEVDFTRDCDLNPTFERLLTVLLGPSVPQDPNVPPDFDEPLYNAVGGATEHRLQFDEAREWNGLRLREVRLLQGIESGPTNFGLAFEDSPERVRQVWNVRGWNLPPAGELRQLELEDEIDTSIGIEVDGALTTVTCYSD